MDLSAHLQQAAAAASRSDFSAAESLYMEAAGQVPADARLVAQAAMCAWRQNAFARAGELQLQAVTLEPWALRHWISYAMCLQALGRDGDSRHVWERLHAFRPDDPRLKTPPKSSSRKASREVRTLCEALRSPRITACLIVRDEEKMLGACLQSIEGAVDQIVVVDTGSQDRTVAIARQAAAEVSFFPWVDDFSAARNAAIDAATGDWILSIDADTLLAPHSHDELRGVSKDELRGAFSVIIDNHLGSGRHVYARVVRIYRRHPLIRYEGRIHEQITPAIKRAGFVGAETHILCQHDGYRPEVVGSKGKLARNERLLRMELERAADEPYWWYQLGKNHMMGEDFAAARAAFSRACSGLALVENRAELPYAQELYAAAPRLLSAAGAIDEALAIAEEGARHFPRSPDIAFFRGQALLELGRKHDAMACFRTVTVEREHLADPLLLPLAEEALAAEVPSEKVPALYTHDFIALKKCRHGTFMFNRHDAFIGRSLDLYGEWCDAELRLLLPLLRRGMIVLDVGANIGTHTVPLARAVGPQGHVVAFEPQAFVYQILAGNIVLNALSNVTTVRAAVGADTGVVDIPRLDPHELRNFGAVQAGAGTDTVELTCIDALGLCACHLIKIDVEGMEVSVLHGARETIARFQPMIFVENDTVERSRPLLEALDALGYSAYWHIAPYYDPTNFFGEARNVFARYQPEANLVALPKGTPATGLEPVRGVDDDWKKAVQRLLRSSNHL